MILDLSSSTTLSPEAPTLPALQGERTGKPDFLSADFDRAPFIVIWAVSYTHLTLPTIYSV